MFLHVIKIQINMNQSAKLNSVAELFEVKSLQTIFFCMTREILFNLILIINQHDSI